VQSPKYFVRDATGLVREFGSLDVLLFASAMVFALVYTTTQFPWFYGNTQGASLPGSLLVAAVPFIFLMLTYWVIGLVMPRTGSDYVWVSRVFSPSIGFVWSLFYILMVFLVGYVGEIVAFSYAFSITMTTGGLVTGSSALTNAGNFLGSGNGTFFLAIVFTIIFAAFAIFGARFIKGLLYVSWVAAIVGIALMWYILDSVSNATFVNNWNSLLSSLGTTATYSAVQAAAAANGAPSGLTGFGGIIIALPLAALFLFGSNNVNAFAGEMKNIKKAIPIALFLALFLGIIYWTITSTLTLNAVGANWMQQVGYVWNCCSSNPKAYTLPFAPSQPLMLAVAAYPNSALISLMFITYILGSIAPLFAFFWIPSKYIFAWSFDRVVPTKFSETSQRFGTPYLSIIGMAVIGIGLSIPYAYYGWGSTFTVGSVLWGIALVVPGLALMVFPFVKKDMFKLSPGFTSKKIGGLPVVSIFGLFAAIGFGYLGYIALNNSLYGSGAVGVFNTFTYELIAAIIIIGFVIYGTSYFYHKSRGVNIAMAFSEIPPE
jgi:amino acid transporter